MVKESSTKNKHKQKLSEEGHLTIQHNLKAKAYDSSLKKIRQRLPIRQRLFSNVTQSKPVDSLSEIAGRTIARPYSLLCASTIALVGTSTTAYYASHYGYPYNYSLIIYFFIAGYALGLIIEFIAKLIRTK